MNANAGDSHFFEACHRALERAEVAPHEGRVRSVIGPVIEADGPRGVRVGSVCRLRPAEGGDGFDAEVVGFRDDRFALMALESPRGIAPGWRVTCRRARAAVPCGPEALGRVLDGLGRPLDDGPALLPTRMAPLHREPEPALVRPRVTQPLSLGVRALDVLTTAGRGGRLGIFAGSGVGKSTLLGQIARYTDADVAVIALIGERGREVRDFLERDLGDALATSVVVTATSDESAAMRVRAALAATAIAESFRDEGRHVLLLMDSLTRFCTATREIGLAAGEPPATRGYPPSMWSSLPRLLERAGTGTRGGSITGIYTVLVEGDDQLEPVADAARSLLDGHIVLSRRLAERGHFPSVDVLASVSRVMPDVASPDHLRLAQSAREALAVYRDAEDLIATGAYQSGGDPRIDAARRLEPALREFLQQSPDERSDVAQALARLTALFAEDAS